MLSQKALDLDMDGLMIESHIDPSNALSDAEQQITPTELAALFKGLIVRRKDVNDDELSSMLYKLRKEIDLIDSDILEKLAARFKIIEEIGEEKRLKGVTILQVDRWNEIIATRKELANKLGLSDEFVSRLLQIVHKESINHQIKIMN